MTIYCDNCGEPRDEQQMYHYERLPFDVDSANKGESGSLCEQCEHTHRRNNK